MPKSRRKKELCEQIHKPQKLKWHNHKTFNTFPEANSERIKLLETQQNVKVRRTGEEGSKFTVKIGSPVKNKKGEEKDNAQE